MGEVIAKYFQDDPSYDQLKNQLNVVLTEKGILHCR